VFPARHAGLKSGGMGTGAKFWMSGLTSRKDADAIRRDIKTIYTAPNEDAALVRLEELEEKWGKKYRAMIRLSRKA